MNKKSGATTAGSLSTCGATNCSPTPLSPAALGPSAPGLLRWGGGEELSRSVSPSQVYFQVRASSACILHFAYIIVAVWPDRVVYFVVIEDRAYISWNMFDTPSRWVSRGSDGQQKRSRMTFVSWRDDDMMVEMALYVPNGHTDIIHQDALKSWRK